MLKIKNLKIESRAVYLNAIFPQRVVTKNSFQTDFPFARSVEPDFSDYNILNKIFDFFMKPLARKIVKSYVEKVAARIERRKFRTRGVLQTNE